MGCGDDDENVNPSNCTSNTFAMEFQSEIDAISAATLTYGSDPTPANCEALKEAYLNYIDAVEAYEECARLANQLTEWQNAIEMSRDAINNIVC